MTKTIEAWVVLRKDGTPKEHIETKGLAIFLSKAVAEDEAKGKLVFCQISYFV